MKSKKGIIFDLDGTLIDSINDVHTCINRALSDMQFPALSNTDIHTLIGPDLRVTLPKVVNNPLFKFDDFQIIFANHYNQLSTKTTALFPNVSSTLKTLKQQNKHCFILTNKPETQSRDILKTLGILPLISCVIGPDTFNAAKPNPIGVNHLINTYNLSKEDLVLVGDTETDIKTAKAAGIQSVAVLYGYRKKEELSKENPDHYIRHIDELLTLN